jgi:hypothetical protein
MAGIHRFESENIPEEGTIRFGVFAVDDDMRTKDHELSLLHRQRGPFR